jgi:manganese transport protein
MLAVIPAVFTILAAGDEGTYHLLLLSQVILSMQLPFAVFPLVMFTSDRRKMGEFVNPGWIKALSWTVAVFIAGLNGWLLLQVFRG